MSQQTLWYLSTVLCGATLVRLAHQRLLFRSCYKEFGAMQAAMLLRDLLLFFIPVQSLNYTIAWEITLPLVLATQVAAGIGCYRSIAALYPGIGKFAVKLFGLSLVATALISCSGLPLEVHNWHSEPIWRTLIITYRWIDTLLAGGLVLAVAFLCRFPAPLRKLPRNLVRHTALLASYFGLYAVCYFLPVASVAVIDNVRTGLVCCLYFAWTVALSKAGEEREAWPKIDTQVLQWIIGRQQGVKEIYERAAREGLR